MKEEKYIRDLRDIREIMDRSSRFISLSGLSGVSAGVVALVGAYAAYHTIYQNQDYLGYRQAILTRESVTLLLGIAVLTLVVAIGLGIWFTYRQAIKKNQKLWDHQSKRLFINLMIPLTAGGILCLILLSKGFIGLLAPLTLVFYGLALINASKYTLHEIRSLGIVEVALGLIATYFIGFGLFFWALGFGVMHIIYGVIMHLKYRS